MPPISAGVCMPARALGVAALVALAGCNPIGTGTGPVSLTLNSPNGTLGAADGVVYECIRSGITAILTFENGAAADFTQRVEWTSSDPTVVRVSDGRNEPVPGVEGSFFGPGVLTPVRAGTATITGRFSDFTQSMRITVRPVPELVMQQRSVITGLLQPLAALAPPADGVEIDPPQTQLRMAPSSLADLTITANLDGAPTAVDAAVQWAFDAAPDGATSANADIATIDNTGFVTALAADSRPLVARATFAPCGRSLATRITVAPITALSLVPEFGAQPLIVPNAQRYAVLADFGDGPEQDISVASVLTSSDSAIGTFAAALLGLPTLLSSIAPGELLLTLTSPVVPDAPEGSEPTITQTLVEDTLTGIRLEPETVVAIAGSTQICPLRVVGLYASGAEQDITRRTAFTAADTAVASVSSLPQSAGLVSVASGSAGETTITAQVSSGVTGSPFTDTATYRLLTPVLPMPETCPQTFAPLPGVVPPDPEPEPETEPVP